MSTRSNRTAIWLLAFPFLLLAACGDKNAGADNVSGDSTTASASSDGGAGDVTTKNIALSRDYVEKVFNQGDTAFVRAVTDPAFVEHNPYPGQEPGVDGIVKMLVEWRASFPDMKVTIDDIIAHDDLVCIRTTMVGTNTGPMMGQPATNKTIKVEGIDIVRIKEGKQTEHWGQFDVMGMMTQLGLMPPMGDASASGGETQSKNDSTAKPSIQ